MTAAVLAGAVLEVDAPPGWLAMPDPDAEASVVWPFEVVGRCGFAGPDAPRAARALSAALERARAQDRRRRRRWVLVGSPPVPAVQAWALLDVLPRTSAGALEAADRWESGARSTAPAGAEAVVWHREVVRTAVAGDPAVLVHDLLTVPGGGQQVVQHRAVVTRFPDLPVLLVLAVSTPLLAALPALESAALAFAAGVRVTDPA